MITDVEVAGGELRVDFEDRLRVEQQRTDHRLVGFGAVRLCFEDGGGHGEGGKDYDDSPIGALVREASNCNTSSGGRWSPLRCFCNRDRMNSLVAASIACS